MEMCAPKHFIKVCVGVCGCVSEFSVGQHT